MAKDVSKLLTKLQAKFGENTIMTAAQLPQHAPVSSGSLALDFAIGIGGLPSDRVIEIAGAEGTGKTTLALLSMQKSLEAQPGRHALILDLEHKMDPNWLTMLVGEELLTTRILYAQPNHIEEATNIYKEVVGSGEIAFAVLDSIGGSPTARRNDDAEVASYGGNALGVGEFARSAAIYSAKYRCCTVGINQIRADMGGYNRHMVPGGRAWLHAVALRLQLKRGKGKLTKKISGEEWQIGYEVACKVIKSGVGAPGRTATYWFVNVPSDGMFGIDTQEELIRLGILTGVIERTGGWYRHSTLPLDKGEHRVLGRDRLMEFFRSDDAASAKVSAEIVAKLQDHAADVAPVSDPDRDLTDEDYKSLGLPDDPKDMSDVQLDSVARQLQEKFDAQDA